VEIPILPYSDYSYHKLAKQALIDITNKQHSKTDEKLALIKELVTTILKFSFLDKKADLSSSRYLPIVRNTRIHPDFIVIYLYVDGSFLPNLKENKVKQGYFSIDEDGFYNLNIMNLYPIFILCLELQKQLERTGNYSIPEALEECRIITTGFSVTRKVRKARSANS
jgi:hypothetical protein